MKKVYRTPHCSVIELQFESAIMGTSRLQIGNPPGGSSNGYGEAEQWSQKYGWSSDDWTE